MSVKPLPAHPVTFCGECPWVCSIGDIETAIPYCRLDEQGREVSKTPVPLRTPPRWCPLRKGPHVIHLATRKRLGSSR